MCKLVLKDVEKNFKDKKALYNINLILSNGVYGLLGENGAGKTTLMRIISVVLQESKGEVLYGGINIKKLGAKYRDKLGYLPQEFGYYPDYSAEQFLLYMAALKGLPETYAKSRVSELIDMVGLDDVKNKRLKSFSGGMIKRVGIAQALLNNPLILILDEPTSGLDPKERVRFRNIISSLSKDRIILLSTHIVTDIEYIADKIIMMKRGQIAAYGPIEEIISSIKNEVWECDFKGEIEEMQSKYIISNLKHQDSLTKLRIISKEKPTENAVCVEPTLEDAYLFHLYIEK